MRAAYTCNTWSRARGEYMCVHLSLPGEVDGVLPAYEGAYWTNSALPSQEARSISLTPYVSLSKGRQDFAVHAEQSAIFVICYTRVVAGAAAFGPLTHTNDNCNPVEQQRRAADQYGTICDTQHVTLTMLVMMWVHACKL